MDRCVTNLPRQPDFLRLKLDNVRLIFYAHIAANLSRELNRNQVIEAEFQGGVEAKER